MRVLVLTWEFPPLIAGGMGMACYGMISALLNKGVEVDLILPTKEFVYFPLRVCEDVDKLPVKFIDESLQKEFESVKFKDIQEKLEYIGITEHPETYWSQESATVLFKEMKNLYETERVETIEKGKVWRDLASNLSGEEDIFKKVQEFTLRAERLAALIQFDVIHAHDWLTYPAGMLLKKLTNKPLVVHVHATEFDRAGGTGNEKIHKIEHAGMIYADSVIAVSKYTAQMIMSRYMIDTAKIQIIHNAYTVQAGANSEKCRLFSGPTILFLGRITLQKGPDYFLEVADKVLESHPEARFIMAGTGDMGRKLIRKSAALRLKNRFLFSGFLNRNQVDTILRASDIYMQPSVSEPFGIAPLEAMAYGVTAIISKQSGVAEIVKNAFKIDFWDVDRMAETLIYLIENPAVREEMSRKGSEEVHRIQWSSVAEKLIVLYADIMKQGRQA